MQDFIIEYLEREDLKSYKGVAIIGSYATGKENKWSDIDLIFITDEKKDTKIEIYNHKYYVSSYYQEEDLEHYFKNPKLMINGLKAFANMNIVYDQSGMLKRFKKKANDFELTSVQIEHCKYRAKNEFISYIEEAQKGIQGIKEQHIGKMLNAQHGLSFGMFLVIRLRDQIMLESDNDIFQVVYDQLEAKDPVRELSKHVFNIIPGSLEDQIDAGLEIFMHVSNSLMNFFTDEEKEYIMKLVVEIIQVI